MADSEQEDAIKVTDRRMFGMDGELRADLVEEVEEEDHAAEATEAEATMTSEARVASAGEQEQRPDQGFEHRPLEEPQGVDFAMLVSGMAQSALIYLGEIANPGTGQPEINLEQARLQIDLLDVLRVKCRGNLTPEEEGLLEKMLYQLRMLCIARGGGTPGEPTPGQPTPG